MPDDKQHMQVSLTVRLPVDAARDPGASNQRPCRADEKAVIFLLGRLCPLSIVLSGRRSLWVYWRADILRRRFRFYEAETQPFHPRMSVLQNQ